MFKRIQCDHVDTDACDTLTRMPIIFCRQRMAEGGLTRGGQFRISSLEKVETECIQESKTGNHQMTQSSER